MSVQPTIAKSSNKGRIVVNPNTYVRMETINVDFNFKSKLLGKNIRRERFYTQKAEEAMTKELDLIDWKPNK